MLVRGERSYLRGYDNYLIIIVILFKSPPEPALAMNIKWRILALFRQSYPQAVKKNGLDKSAMKRCNRAFLFLHRQRP